MATALAGSLSACALKLPMTSLLDEDEITTSSVTPRKPSRLSSELGEEDWRRARNAMGLALDPHAPGTPVSWDNPDTKLKGTFRSAGQPFVKDDEICRTFAATLAGPKANSALEGTACRPSGGEWTLKEVAPKKG